MNGQAEKLWNNVKMNCASGGRAVGSRWPRKTPDWSKISLREIKMIVKNNWKWRTSKEVKSELQERRTLDAAKKKKRKKKKKKPKDGKQKKKKIKNGHLVYNF
jgi:hypothetical protein